MKSSLPPLIAVIHLAALPGSPGFRGKGLTGLVDRARSDCETLCRAGFGGIIVENFGDAPFFKEDVPSITLTSMTRIVAALADFPVLLGVNVLRNDALGALSVAAATGAAFIRVNVHTGAMVSDQGVIEGRAAETLRFRESLAPDVQILADVLVKHAQPLAPVALGQVAEETLGRGRADGLIVTGSGTGQPTSLADVRLVKEVAQDAPVYVGSGVTHETVAQTLEVADGVIVGSALKYDGLVTHPVDPERAQRFVQAAGKMGSR